MKKRKRTTEHEDGTAISKEEWTEDEDGGGAAASAKVQKLKRELAACTRERREYLEGWQRARADLINVKKDMEVYTNERAQRASEALIHGLIPVLDSFDMATGDRETWERVDENWRRGIEHIHAQLWGALEQHGVKRIEPLGEKFDPALHESVDTVSADRKQPANTVTKVLQCGYAVNGKVLRPAKVVVATST